MQSIIHKTDTLTAPQQQFSFFEMGQKSINERFVAFHQQNPRVYELFVAFAKQLIKRQIENPKVEVVRIGAKMIIERIRWEMATGSIDEMGFKINNDFIAHYARLFMAEYKQYNGCFETRGIRTP